MAPSIRIAQGTLCLVTVLFAILVCCSTPTSRKLNFYTNVDSIGLGTGGANNPVFQGLVLGVRGFCNQNGCATYDDYAADSTEVNARVKLAGGELDAVALLAGQIGELGRRPLQNLNVLTIVASAATGLAFGASAMMAVIRKKAVQTTLLGSLLVACALNISTWTFALHIFLKAEKEIAKDTDHGKFGPAFYLSLFTWILLLAVAALEPLLIDKTRDL